MQITLKLPTPYIKMVVVVDGETSKLQACDMEAFDLQKCLFREDYDFTACQPYVQALQNCCHNFKAISFLRNNVSQHHAAHILWHTACLFLPLECSWCRGCHGRLKWRKLLCRPAGILHTLRKDSCEAAGSRGAGAAKD